MYANLVVESAGIVFTMLDLVRIEHRLLPEYLLYITT